MFYPVTTTRTRRRNLPSKFTRMESTKSLDIAQLGSDLTWTLNRPPNLKSFQTEQFWLESCLHILWTDKINCKSCNWKCWIFKWSLTMMTQVLLTLMLVSYTPKGLLIFWNTFVLIFHKLYGWKRKNPWKSFYPLSGVYMVYGIQNDYLNLSVYKVLIKSSCFDVKLI